MDGVRILIEFNSNDKYSYRKLQRQMRYGISTRLERLEKNEFLRRTPELCTLRRTSIPVVPCPQHPDNIVDLQTVARGSQTGEERQFYRCKGRPEGKSFCGSFQVQKKSQNSSKSDKALKDYNYQHEGKGHDGDKSEQKKVGSSNVVTTDKKQSRKDGSMTEKSETGNNEQLTENLANLSLDEGHHSKEKMADERSSQSKGWKLKLKKQGEETKSNSSPLSDEEKKIMENRSDSAKSVPDKEPTSVRSKTDVQNSKVISPDNRSPEAEREISNSKYRDISNTSSSSDNSSDHISDSGTPSPSHKYAGISNIRIKKKSPQKNEPLDCNVPLAERIRMKSGESGRSESSSSIGSISSAKSPDPGKNRDDDVIDLISDDDSDEDLPKITRPKSPEEQVKRYSPPASLANVPAQKSNPINDSGFVQASSLLGNGGTTVTTQSQQPVKGLTPAEQWQLEQDIANRNSLMNQLQRQKNVIATVKMSSLPDHGEKLRKQIDDLERAINKLSGRIRNLQAKGSGNPTVPSVQAQTTSTAPVSSSQQQVYKVYSKGPNGETKLIQVIQPGANPLQNLQVPITAMSGTQGSHHVPHNPMNLKQTSILPHAQTIPPHILQQLYAANPQAMTLYGGRMTAARLREVGSVTKEAIEKLHKQLETIPDENTETEDPTGLKVDLMMHQRQALSWLIWRERQHPPGGILADDMGLGKTLTMISLVLKQRQLKETGEEKEAWLNRDKQLDKLGKDLVKSNGTLVICPASLIHQWNSEIERRVKPGRLKVLLYHGQNREKNILKLADNDIVLTTYNLVGKEVGAADVDADAPASEEDKVKVEGDKDKPTAEPTLLRIAWERIILDEAHNIKNRKSLSAMAACRLRANYRWALTGTPIQNELLDLYSLLRFLRCSPFDEYKVWKRQVETGKASGSDRLNVLVKCLLLRRTKGQINKAGKPLVALPSKSANTYEIDLSKEERAVYNRLFSQSRSVLKEYLKQHEDKELGVSSKQPDINPFRERSSDAPGQGAGGGGGSQMAGYGRSPEEAGGEGRKKTGQMVLVMLLRLRQCCCHLSLMKDAFDEETVDTEGLELDLVDQMKDLLLDDGDKPSEVKLTKDSVMFDRSSISSKMKAVMDKIDVIRSQKDKQKCVIVSQWTKMLDIVGHHLTRSRIRYNVIQGSVSAKKRNEMVEEFNTDPRGVEVMLVSLRAGGVGLNLIGGNHLFLLDQHWNPALEDQACDRIYRVGQKRDVFIHRFLCKDTVEEKIVALQKRKQTLAHNVLTGSGAKTSKLTLDDLRMIFGV
ncbi:hypothetical protein FSP39_011239 [Pinctada imbricata]|uniref:Transcription termination factor 2 n=1 Tax=Pinctada imbricata TaxID=66713 RepID=A0AA89C579_PINIB|nr:hypothetical protein FSP39_011239 [Pinctada imbricata]